MFSRYASRCLRVTPHPLHQLHHQPSAFFLPSIHFHHRYLSSTRRCLSITETDPTQPRPRITRPPATHSSPFTPPQLNRAELQHERRKVTIYTICTLGLMVAIWGIAQVYKPRIPVENLKSDASSSSTSRFSTDKVRDKNASVVILTDGSSSAREGGEVELVDSGTSSVPPFPSKLSIPGSKGKEEEYTLIGHGIRTVSFLSIQVYVVGFYVHTDDLATLQSRLIRTIHPIATTATQTEQDEIKKILTDPEKGERVLQDVILSLRGEEEVRSLFRIVPTRNTDWSHLRDGWVRGIQSRSSIVAPPLPSSSPSETTTKDQDLSTSLSTFKSLFRSGLPLTGKSVPKQKTILLLRSHYSPISPRGSLAILYDPTGRNDGKVGGSNTSNEKDSLQKLGEVPDERVSRALWLCYLAGKQVASEECRKRVVEGLVGLVSRPVGTVGR